MTRLEINGNYEVVQEDLNDFSFLVEKYMGFEAKKFFENLLDDVASEIAGLIDENAQLIERLVSEADSDNKEKSDA